VFMCYYCKVASHQRFCLLQQMCPHVFRPSVCMSVTLVHPAIAIGRNEIPFGRDTLVAAGSVLLDGGLVFL